MNRMYDEFADIWPLISHHSEYAGEARYWRDALRAALGVGRLRILELGVGGGNNLHHIVYPDCDAGLSGARDCECAQSGTGGAQHDAVGGGFVGKDARQFADAEPGCRALYRGYAVGSARAAV